MRMVSLCFLTRKDIKKQDILFINSEKVWKSAEKTNIVGEGKSRVKFLAGVRDGFMGPYYFNNL